MTAGTAECVARMSELQPRATEARIELAALKRELRAGTLPLTVAMSDRPALARVPLVDLICWTRGRRGRAIASLEAIGAEAVRDGVNLMIPCGRASERSKQWVAEHGYYGWRRSA